MRLKIAVSVVRFRPWAPLTFPAPFFLVRASSPISKNPRKIRHFLHILTPGTVCGRPRASGDFGYTVGTLEGPGTLAGRPIARGSLPMDELSDTKIRNATPADKEYAIADGQGLSVVVRPNGTKLWLYRYGFARKRKNMSFATFPAVGRVRSTASRVFQFGVGASYCNSDPTRDLKHALTKAPKGNPRPALTDPDDVGDLMRRIEVYDAKNGGLVRYALKLIALTMVRP